VPSVSPRQRKFFGAALRRKKQGRVLAADPQMSENALEDFASKPRKMAGSNPMRYIGGMCHLNDHK